MAMVVRSNIMAVNANRQLSMNNSQVAKSLEKLSSGYRINRAGDDASGLAISEKMKAQIKGLDTASANSQDGVSLIQTAEGALTEVHSMLNRMVELADKAANGTMDGSVDRASLEKEVTALKDEINRISDSTNFNGIKLLNGKLGSAAAGAPTAFGTSTAGDGSGVYAKTTLDLTGLTTLTKDTDMQFTIGSTSYSVAGATGDTASDIADKFVTAYNASKLSSAAGGAYTASNSSGTVTFTATNDAAVATSEVDGTFSSISVLNKGLTLQIGDTADSFNQVTVSIGDMSTKGLNIDTLSVADQTSAAAALDLLKNAAGGGAINTVSATRADLGALQNRLEHTINNLDVASENMTSANSRIRDTDMAKEMMEYTKMNVLTQAAQAMLAQANQQPQSVLQLLQ